MSKTEGTKVEHLFVADHDQTIQGSLTGGIVVQRNVKLVVQGNVDGPITIMEDGLLSVYGMLDGYVVSNDGSLIAAGLVAIDLREATGRFAVAVGTMFTAAGGSPRILAADGSLEVVRGKDHNVTTEVKSYRAYNEDTGLFEDFNDV